MRAKKGTEREAARLTKSPKVLRRERERRAEKLPGNGPLVVHSRGKKMKPARSNDDLVEYMQKHGMVKTPAILEAFRAVDRGDFATPHLGQVQDTAMYVHRYLTTTPHPLRVVLCHESVRCNARRRQCDDTVYDIVIIIVLAFFKFFALKHPGGVPQPTGAGRRRAPVRALHLRRRPRGAQAEAGHVFSQHRESLEHTHSGWQVGCRWVTTKQKKN